LAASKPSRPLHQLPAKNKGFEILGAFESLVQVRDRILEADYRIDDIRAGIDRSRDCPAVVAKVASFPGFNAPSCFSRIFVLI